MTDVISIMLAIDIFSIKIDQVLITLLQIYISANEANEYILL